MGRCAFLSFRLGGSDGVSVVARQWQSMFESLGWDTVTIAGEGPVDHLIPGLAIGAESPPSVSALEAALVDVDLVVVENLLTIPMQLAASRAVAAVLAGRPALLHHHDPPWQRDRFASITELPATDPAWRHVTINRLTQTQMSERGIEATTIYNAFSTRSPVDLAGLRSGERLRLGVTDNEPLIVHPVRAIERKNLPAAIKLAEAVEATYWLTGPAEEGYAEHLDQLLASAGTRVIHESASSLPALYAAADLVVFPSLWEGFGNPPVEAAIFETPVVVGNYPVAAEQRALGFDWPSFDWLTEADSTNDRRATNAVVDYARSELFSPNQARLSHNRQVAVERLDTAVAIERLQCLLDQAGWHP